MFYNYQQVIRDNFNAVICVGTSYLARRAALESINGYVTTCIIEDHQTGTRLLTEGWRIVYLNEILSVGETPGNLRDYIDQRLRWLQGNLQILLPASELPIFSSALTAWQKVFYLIHYASNFLPVGRAFFIFIPLFSLYLGNQLIIAPVDAYISYALPFILLLHTIPSWSSGNHTHQIWSEVYETIVCVPWTIRLAKILRKPFRIYGNTVTPKDRKINMKHLDRPLARHLIVYIILFLLFYHFRFGAPILFPGFQIYPVQSEGQEVMIIWTIYNFSLVFVALLLESSPEVKVNFIDQNLALSGRVVRITTETDCLPRFSVMFNELSEDQESRLLQILYNPANKFLQTRIVSAGRSIILFVTSLLRSSSLLQSFKS